MAPEISVNACLNHGSMKLTGRYFAVFGAAIISLAAFGASAPTEVMIHEEKPFPESLSSTSDGTLYIGSIAKSEILRSSHGAATAEPWIKPGTNGLQRVLGVLADQRSNTLWVCSSKAPQGGSPTALKTFDLKSGASKGSF